MCTPRRGDRNSREVNERYMAPKEKKRLTVDSVTPRCCNHLIQTQIVNISTTKRVEDEQISEILNCTTSLLTTSTVNMDCKICLDAPSSCAFVPCGHVVACKRCSLKIDKCPICRDCFETTINIFIC
jgi:hypothetical protein